MVPNEKKGDTSTEEKIKNAARLVFHQKGYAGTRTRDIAEQAGINLALLNYYFRSKQKLFDLIMLETMQDFIQSMKTVFNDKNTSLQSKVEAVASRYIDLLIKEPEIPLFIMSELRANPEGLLQKMKFQEVLMKSTFIRQYRIEVVKGEIAPQNLLHFIINVIGLTVFPFVASPILRSLGDLTKEQFNALMVERKAFIPKWVYAMMKVS